MKIFWSRFLTEGQKAWVNHHCFRHYRRNLEQMDPMDEFEPNSHSSSNDHHYLMENRKLDK